MYVLNTEHAAVSGSTASPKVSNCKPHRLVMKDEGYPNTAPNHSDVSLPVMSADEAAAPKHAVSTCAPEKQVPSRFLLLLHMSLFTIFAYDT